MISVKKSLASICENDNNNSSNNSSSSSSNRFSQKSRGSRQRIRLVLVTNFWKLFHQIFARKCCEKSVWSRDAVRGSNRVRQVRRPQLLRWTQPASLQRSTLNYVRWS